jgi:DNA invertase Pin-like site-specific DNA recombinase
MPSGRVGEAVFRLGSLSGMSSSARHQAGIYVRISSDRTGSAAGVKRQAADCRALAERQGWEVIDTYRDNDISAFSGRPRPEFDRMMRDLKDGRIDAVIAWHVDRLTRSPRELEDVVEAVERTGASIATVQAGEFDLGTASGRMIARVVGSVARHESEHMGERVARQRAEAALHGLPQGGRRAYGYKRDLLHVREDEAAMVREAAARYLSGESFRAIALDWNARGVPSASGGAWTVPSMRTMLTSPRIAGRSVHHGQDVGPAQWPAIISQADHEAIKAVVSDRRRTPRGRPPSRLLSGAVRCGRCGARMSVSRRAGRGTVRFTCQRAPGKDGCGGISIVADQLEELVTEALLLATDGPALRKLLAAHKRKGAKSALSEIARAESKLEALARDHARDLLSRREWLAAKAELDARITELRGEANADVMSASAALEPFTRKGALRAAWPTLDLERRRAVLAAVIQDVVINPASRPGRTEFEPERVDITWRA